MDVRLPNGQILTGIPDGTSRADVAAKLQSNGFDVPNSWMHPPAQQQLAPPTPGLGESVQHTAERAALPTGGFFAGMGAMGATGIPEAALAIPVAGPIVATGLELAGGFGGSALVDKLQEMGAEAFPEFAKRHGLDKATAAREQAAHPVGTALAGAAPMLLTNKFGAIENAKNLWEAGSQVVRGGVKSLTKEQAAKAAVPLVAGGIQGGINAAQQMISDQPFDYGDLATQAAIGASFGDERALGRKLKSYGAKATETVKNVFRPGTREFLGDDALLKPAVQNAAAADTPAPTAPPAAPKDALAEHMDVARQAILDHGDEQERGAHVKAVEAATGLPYPKANALVNRLAKGENRIITGASKKDGLRRVIAPAEAETPGGLSVDDLTQPLQPSQIESPSQPAPDYTTQLRTSGTGEELGGFPVQKPTDFTPLIPPEVSVPAPVPAESPETDPRGTVLNFVNTSDKPTVKSIQAATGMTYGEVTKHLNSLKDDGVIAYNPSSRKWEPTSVQPPAGRNTEPDAGKPAEGAGPPVPPDTADGGSVDLTPSERLGITRAPSESPVRGTEAKPAPLTAAGRKDPTRVRRSAEIANENGLISDDDYFRIQNELKRTNPNYLLIEKLMAGKGKHAVPIEPMEPVDAGPPEPPTIIKAKPKIGIPADLAPEPGTAVPESKPLTPEQQAAGTTQIKGKTGVNQVRAADIIAQQHGVTEELPAVTVKEMLQNSFDAVREMLRAGTLGKGRIDLTGDKDSRTIAMTDNGKGMSPDTLAGPFLEILGEGKDEGSGGFGAAKTVFLYGNKDIHVVTMHNGKVSEMRTSGDQLRASLADSKHAPDIEVRDPTPEDHAMFPDGHGTRVSVKLPETFKDTEGATKDLPFDPSGWGSSYGWGLPDALRGSPLFADIDVSANGRLLKGIGSTFDTEVHQPFVNVKFNWGNAEVYIGHGDAPHNNLRYLSDGIWQFSQHVPKDPSEAYGDPIPYNFYVNIIPKARPGKPEYPFSLNRKSLLDWAKKDMQKIINHITSLYRYADLKDSAESFGTVRYFDKNGQLTAPVEVKPDIPPPPSKFTAIKKGDKISVEDGKLLINGKPQQELTAEELKSELPAAGKLLVDQNTIDAKSPIVHDNMDVVNRDTGERMSISDFMRSHYGQQFDAYTHVVADTFLRLRDEVARVMGYPDLHKEAVGISFDPEYRGVSTRVPFSGSFINPLSPESSHPVKSGFGMLSTMIHELAHHKVRDHDASFPAEMQRITYELEAEIWEKLDSALGFDFNQFKHDFVKAIQPYSDIISYGHELIQNRKNTTRKFDIEARGSRFKDGEQESGTRDGDASRTPVNAERSAERVPGQSGGSGTDNGAAPPPSGGGSGQGSGTPPGNGNVAPGKGPRRLKAAPVPETADGFIEHLADAQKAKYAKPSVWERIKSALIDSPHETYEKYAYLVQNDKRYIKKIEDDLDITDSNIIGGKDATNLYSTLTRVSDMAVHAARTIVNPLVHEFNVLMKGYAEKTGLDINKARATISAYRIALHEPERRWEKFRTDVPFSTQKRPMGNTGRMVSPADLREMLIKKLADKKTTIAEGKKIGAALDALARDPANIDPLGESPSRKGPAPMPTDMHDPFYSVLGEYNKTLIDNLTDAYHKDPHKAEADAIIAHLDKIQDITKGLNYKAHYWNDYAEKISQAYGFQHYAPFRGMLRLDKRHEGGGGISKDYSDFAESMEGRVSEADDNVLQTLAELSRAAGRATRTNDDTGNVTQIIKNLIDRKILAGKKVGTVLAEDRFLDKKIDKKFYGPDKIAHNLPNGDIEVYRISDPRISEAIRRQYEENNPLMQLAHQMASAIGQLHTRYKIPFAPMNFTRHTLSNAWNLGSKEGIGAMGSYLQHVATSIIDLKMADTFKLSMLIADGKTAEIEKLRASDPYMRDAIEYMELGGKATYSQIYTARSHMAELEKSAGENKLLSTKEMVDKYFDAWNDMFDIVSRSSLYHVAKKMYLGRGMDEAGAKIKAAAIAKEVTNYKLVGKYGRDAATLWLFFRPAATSSVAAIDALRPAWQSTEWRVKQLPEADQKDPAKVQAAIENHKKLQTNARIIASVLVGAGAFTYEMSLQGSNNDPQGRNRVATDDMGRWVRFARLPILGKEGFFQMPWGFGLGGLGSIGAQVTALAHGNQSVREAAGNIITAAADSGLPISPSHISPTKSWKSALEFAVDTITPSGPGIRPVVEYLMNSDSMGSEIYNTRQGKYSDVYTGGENIPQGYKDAARLLFHITGGAIEMSPNTMYFFAANYVDAIADMANMMYNASNVLQGKKGFDLKSDTPLFGSFLGRDSNYDARKFESVQEKLQDKSRILNTLKMSDIHEYADYISKHPMDSAAVREYNSTVNGQLKQIQTRIKGIRLDNNLTQEQREKEIKAFKLYENIVKANLVRRFEALGVEP